MYATFLIRQDTVQISFDEFGEKRIGDVGNDQPDDAASARRETAGVGVRVIAAGFDGAGLRGRGEGEGVQAASS